MIIFHTCDTTIRVLEQINRCINEMVDFELSSYFEYYDYQDDKEKEEFLGNYFPEYLCREDAKKCMNVLLEIKEWTSDLYFHEMTCLHEYALYHIFESYFNYAEEMAREREEGEEAPFEFYIKNLEQYNEEELEIINLLNERFFYQDCLFFDLDFLDIDQIVFFYQIGSVAYNILGVNINYYLDLMPKDIREEIKKAQIQEENSDEKIIINQIKNTIKLRERYPNRLFNMSEEELSDDIKDLTQLALQKDGIIIEREARGGFANSKVGENDLFLYKVEAGKIIQLAVGENKIWNNFEKQVKQLIGYMNENIEFGFTIVFNKTMPLIDVRNKQIEILKNNKELNLIDIIEKENNIISIHMNPENSKKYKIYHLIVNAYHPEREQISREVRKK